MKFLNLVLITVAIAARTTTNAGELASSYACPTWYIEMHWDSVNVAVE